MSRFGVIRSISKWLMPPRLCETIVFALLYLRAKSLGGEDAARMLLRLDNRLYGLQGRAAVSYGDGVHTKHRHTRYHDFFVQRLRPGDRVLDVGCGFGALAVDLAKIESVDVVAIDIDERRIREARDMHSHPRVEYVVGDATVDLPTGTFDVAVLSNVLEHIEKRTEFLRSLVAASGCRRLLVRVPSYERDWRVPLKDELGVDYRLDSTHCIEHDEATLRQEISDANLAVTHLQSRWGELWLEAVPEGVDGS